MVNQFSPFAPRERVTARERLAASRQKREERNRKAQSQLSQYGGVASSIARQLSNQTQQTLDAPIEPQIPVEQQQAFDQQGMDTDYQDFLNQQRYPYQQLEFMNSMLRGTPMGTVQSMYQPAPSTIQNLGSLGMTAAGIGALTRAQGGEIPGYKSGGEITGGLGAIALNKLV